MNAASTTPASVACTPDFSTAIHMTTPMRIYDEMLVTPRRFMVASKTRHADATSSAVVDTSPE
jgi:hypothetical protein